MEERKTHPIVVDSNEDIVSDKLTVKAVGITAASANNHLAITAKVINRAVNNYLVKCSFVILQIVGIAVNSNKLLVCNKLTVLAVVTTILVTLEHFAVFTEIVDRAVNNHNLVVYGYIFLNVVGVVVDGDKNLVSDKLTVITVVTAALIALKHLTVFTEIVDSTVDNLLVIYSYIVLDVVSIVVDGDKEIVRLVELT